MTRLALTSLSLVLFTTGALTPWSASAAVRWRAPSTAAADLPFSDSVAAGGLLFLNAQIGNVPGQPGLVSGGLAAELTQALRNIDQVLAAQQLDRRALVSCAVALADIGQWSRFNQLWRDSFSSATLPARSVTGVTGLPLGAAVSVQCVAEPRPRASPALLVRSRREGRVKATAARTRVTLF